MTPRITALRLLATALLALALNGCSGIPGLKGERDPTPPTELGDIRSEVRIQTLWSGTLTRGTEGRALVLVPALDAGQLYVADSRGRLVALDAASGRERWRRETRLAFSGGPAVRDGRLVLGTSNGLLLAFSTEDGRELWRQELGSEVLSLPVFAEGERLLVHTLDDSLHGLDAKSGTPLWRLPYPSPILTLRGSSTPALTADQGLIVGLSGGKLLKLDSRDGVPLWEVTITRPSGRSELARITDIDADPILVGNNVFVATYNGDLAAVDTLTGTVLWRRELSAHAGLAADADGLFITDSSDQLWGASPIDGSGRWTQEALRYRGLSAPALIGNWIAVGDQEGYLHLLERSDGRLVGRVRLSRKGAISARALVHQGLLYVLADDGTLSALRLAPLGASPPPSAQP